MVYTTTPADLQEINTLCELAATCATQYGTKITIDKCDGEVGIFCGDDIIGSGASFRTALERAVKTVAQWTKQAEVKK